MNTCLNCNQSTKNKKFCSRNCSTIFNNTIYPRKKRKVKNCSKCNHEIKGDWKISRRKLCNSCLEPLRNFHTKTIGEIRKQGNSNYKSHIPYVRRHARKSLIESGKNPICQNCSYSLNVETCHIKSINSFDSTALISEINHPSNLMFLCPNCHWEYDHGHLIV